MADCRGFTVRQPVECGSDACDAQSSSAGNQRPSLPLALELVDNQDSMNVDELCEHRRKSQSNLRRLRQVAIVEEDSDEHYARPH